MTITWGELKALANEFDLTDESGIVFAVDDSFEKIYTLDADASVETVKIDKEKVKLANRGEEVLVLYGI